MTHPVDNLAKSLAPRGLSRVQAAAYVGISTTIFDEMVQDGRMPAPGNSPPRTHVTISATYLGAPSPRDRHM